jgi:hypothetical protein
MPTSLFVIRLTPGTKRFGHRAPNRCIAVR